MIHLMFVFFAVVFVGGIGLSVWLDAKERAQNRPKFRAVYRCVQCKGGLRFSQVMGSHGVCPLCGYVSDSTVCDYTKESVPNE